MVLQVGDKVIIKEDLKWYESFGKGINFVPDMSKYLGKEAKVVKVASYDGLEVNLDIDNESFVWHEEMFTKDDDKPSELTLGMLLSKLTEDISVNIDLSFEYEATRIVTENYYSWQLEPYYNRVVKWFAPDFDSGELAILLEGEF
ncbi:hypothetical protein DOABOMFO_00069 [Enterococcus phage EF_KTM]|nr:hypothetical protein ODGCJCGO_00003 [Enterococcus phage EFKL]WQZ01518.1 hypothetical protein DDLHHHOO_00029 [Enterococcus phage EF_RCK]WVH07331.1 hypothetical protein AIMFIBHH_00041 [Enterococcus phage EF_TR1]